MLIQIGSLDISVADDHVEFSDLDISAAARVTKPLRSTDATPTADGGTTVQWRINVTRTHASLAASLAYYTGLPTAVAAITDVTTTPKPQLTLGGVGSWPNAAIMRVTCRRVGVTTYQTWEILTSPTYTPTP